MAHLVQHKWNSLSSCTSLIDSPSSNQGGLTSHATNLKYRHCLWRNNMPLFKLTKESTVIRSSSRFVTIMVCAHSSVLVSEAKDDDQIPPLSTVLQYLNPPVGVSTYASEAELILSKFTSTWGLKPSALKRFEVYKSLGLSMSVLIYPKCVSAERLAATSLIHSLFFLLDDICFDCQGSSETILFAEDFGVDPSIWQDILLMQRFWERLLDILKSSEKPSVSSAIERALWEAGRIIRSLSPSETWFLAFVKDVHQFSLGAIDFQLHAGTTVSNAQEIESSTEILIRMTGMDFTCALIELTSNEYMSAEARNDPQIRRLVYLCARYASFSNSLFSYDKEVSVRDEKKPVGNHIQVMMDRQNMSFHQAVRRLMSMIVADNILFLEIEKDPHVSHLISVDDGLRSYMECLKYMYGGTYEFQRSSGRYRTLNSPFPELRIFKPTD